MSHVSYDLRDRRGKIHPQKDVRNGVIEYDFPGSQMLEYGFPGDPRVAWGSTNPKITNDHFLPLRSTHGGDHT